MKFSDIEKYPFIGYSVHVSWEDIESAIERYKKNYDLQLCPDFQRGHVWTEAQQIAYVEYMLKEPQSGGNVILFNHPNWMHSYEGEFDLVDGLQRLTAAMKFLNNELRAYGHYYREYEGRLSDSVKFVFQISNLKTRKDVLKWYLQLNTGGTQHSVEEIERVKKLYEEASNEK